MATSLLVVQLFMQISILIISDGKHYCYFILGTVSNSKQTFFYSVLCQYSPWKCAFKDTIIMLKTANHFFSRTGKEAKSLRTVKMEGDHEF